MFATLALSPQCAQSASGLSLPALSSASTASDAVMVCQL
jgi:hypothetical protein